MRKAKLGSSSKVKLQAQFISRDDFWGKEGNEKKREKVGKKNIVAQRPRDPHLSWKGGLWWSLICGLREDVPNTEYEHTFRSLQEICRYPIWIDLFFKHTCSSVQYVFFHQGLLQGPFLCPSVHLVLTEFLCKRISVSDPELDCSSILLEACSRCPV